MLAVKTLGDGSTVTLRCTKYVTHRSNFFWGFSGRSSRRLHFYTVSDKGLRTDFSNEVAGYIDDTQFASIPGTPNWVGAKADTTKLVVFVFDASGNISSIEKLELLFVEDRKNLKTPLLKIFENKNSVVYMTEDGYMKYNYVDKTKNRYEGTLEP
jgi:hypothetical protein